MYIGRQRPMSHAPPTVNEFEGDGTTTAFAMSLGVATETRILVMIGGAVQDYDNFSVSGSTLTFSTAPNDGVYIQVIHLLGYQSYQEIADGSITAAKLDTSIFPAGIINPYAGAAAPATWLLCDGTTDLDSVADTTLADLFAVIGTTYGGVDAENFDLPDMRGRFPLGKDNMGGVSADVVTHANADTLGAAEGAEDHVITDAEMPSHRHSVNHNSGGGGSTWSANILQKANTFGTLFSDFQGSDNAHENMSPYRTLNYIIKK